MKKTLAIGIIGFFSVALFSCSTSPIVQTQKEPQKVVKFSEIPAITGIVDFKFLEKNFETKATTADIIKNPATVALIDPTANKTVAVGLTDANGEFALIANYKVPITLADIQDRVLYLEAYKRFPASIGNIVSLRSLIKYNSADSKFYSITSVQPAPHIINTLTTAVSLLVAKGTIADANTTLQTVTITPGDSTSGTVTNIGAVTSTTIVNLKNQIETNNLAVNTDPLAPPPSTSISGGFGG